MPMTIDALLPILAYAASLAGAAVAASVVFAKLRQAFPLPSAPMANPVQAFAYRLLHAPAQARLVVFGLTAIISIVASVAIALLTNQPTNAAFDAALAIVLNQLWHAGIALPTDVPSQDEE